MTTVGADLANQIKRVEGIRDELAKIHTRFGGCGLMMAEIDVALNAARYAVVSSDVVEIVRAYKQLQDIKELL